MNLIRLHSSVSPALELADAPSPEAGHHRQPLASRAVALRITTRARASVPRRAKAYPVPWRVIARESDRSVTLHNAGVERLSFVRFAVAGTGSLALTLPRHVEPGQTCVVELREPYGGPDTLITVRWFRPDRSEYLWVLSL